MQTVLIADDTDVVRKLCGAVLRKHGYTALEANDGLNALSLAREHRGPIDLLITDMVMPRLGGLDLSRAFRHLYPEARVLFISGYHAETLDLHAPFLGKPFTPDALLHRVNELLSGSGYATRLSISQSEMAQRAYGSR